MNEQHIRLITKKRILTIEEIKEILNYIVNKISTSLDINDSYTRLCKESSISVDNLCDKLNIPYIPFNMSEIGMGELEHHFGITGFNTEYGQICFLLDLTYIQFTEKTYPVNLKNGKGSKQVLSPGMFVSEELKKQLVNLRYITLTESNFEEYVGGFIESYRLANIVDERNAYDKIYELLRKYGINLVDKDYLNSEGKTY
jgi:hypothetical protein